MPSRNPSTPPDEEAPLIESVATELRHIATWAVHSALQAEAVPPSAEDPLYDEIDTGEPRNTAAQIESHLSLLVQEYLIPAKREMARVAGLLQIWRNESGDAEDQAAFSMPESALASGDGALAMTTLSMSFPSEHLVASFAEFAQAVGEHYSMEVKTIAEGRQLALVVVPGTADKGAVRQCLSLLLEPWATTQRRV